MEEHKALEADTKKTKRKIKFIFTTVIVGLLLISCLALIEFNQLKLANQWVNHTYEVILEVKNVLYQFTLAESKQRAYLVFGKASFLTDTDNTIQDLNQAINKVITLTKDNPSQNFRAKELNNLIYKRIDVLKELIKIKDTNHLNSETALDTFNKGQLITQEITEEANNFIQTELILLKERNKIVEKSSSLTNLIFILGQLLGLIFLIYSYWLFKELFIKQHQFEKHLKDMQNQLRSIIEGAYDMIAALDKNLRYLVFNKAYKEEFTKLFGIPPQLGESIESILAKNPERSSIIKSWQTSIGGKNDIQKIEFTINNTINTYEIASGTIKDDEGEIVGAVHIMRDITERIKEQNKIKDSYIELNVLTEELKTKNKKISLLLEMSDVILISSSIQELSNIIAKYCNKILDSVNGNFYLMKASKDLLETASHWGNPKASSKTFVQDQCWALRLGHIHYSTFHNNELICEHINVNDVNKNVGYICVPLRAQNDIYGTLYLEMPLLNEQLIITANEKLIIGTFAELTSLALSNVRLRENLKYQSIRDVLTGLYNRRYLEEFLFKQVNQAERTEIELTILLLDLDHFKRINDMFGHEAGDLILKEFGHVLKNITRSGDLASRYGGEEFIVVLYNVGKQIGRIKAEEIRSAISQLNLKYGASEIGEITVSIGVATFPEDAKTAKDLIALADKALYRAKHEGRNRVV